MDATTIITLLGLVAMIVAAIKMSDDDEMPDDDNGSGHLAKCPCKC